MNPEQDKERSSTAAAHVVWEAIEKDPRVSWRSTEKDRYLYRPGQLLVDAAFESRLKPLLAEQGAAPVRCRSTEGRLLQRLGLRRWVLPADGRDAPDVVDAVRAELVRREGGLEPADAVRALTLNNVLAGAQVFKFGPGDLPVPGEPGPVDPEPSKELGTGRGVRVAVLDTGFVKASTTQPILAHDYADDGDDRDVFYDEATQEIGSLYGGHGTFVAGIVRQKAPDTVVDPEVTLDDVGLVDDVELALDLLRTRPAHIVNLSLAGPTKDDAPPPTLARALAHLGKHTGVVVVAAAGNDFVLAAKAGKPEVPMWPAAFGALPGFEHVVGVAAVDRNVEPSVFSNRGPWVRACAYGVEERSTYVEGKLLPPAGPRQFDEPVARWSGTSFATPRVAGVIAATMTACSPPLSARDALAKILDEAPPGPAGFGKFVE